MKERKSAGLLRAAFDVVREDGVRALVDRTWHYLEHRRATSGPIQLPVAMDDLLAADWTNPPRRDDAPRVSTGPLTVNWIIPPAGLSSGGHNTIFRFIHQLESGGHRCRVYIYDPTGSKAFSEAASILRGSYRPVDAPILPHTRDLAASDALIATSWQTAYAAFSAPTAARRFYLVQDLESLFYPVGSESILAENTYRFGFHGITGGRWLAEKLEGEYGMRCDHFEHGSNAAVYTNEARVPRKDVLFYARPVTARRAFELGVLTLELFHRRAPNTRIHMVGWDVGAYELPFPFINHGILGERALNSVLNVCGASLVMSPTNMSHLPLELLAAGCIPVVNDGPNNRMVSSNPHIVYAPPSPHAMAAALHDTLQQPDLAARAEAASASVQDVAWDDASQKFEQLLLRELRA